MDGSRIPHLSYIGDSIIGERCNLGAGTITANLRLDEKPIRMLVKGELIETGLRKLGVIMGDDVKTGINVSIMPGVKIRSGAFVAAGEVVARDIERA
jgi:bifunctional UDP-N-acetylglucosamine pyrophosphorylase/glucosamine-1-phosphate N-acetyltransferase